jgi:PEP-CTERM motif
MKTFILRVGLPVLVLTIILAANSYASPILVSNFSFETLPLGGLPFSCGTNCSFSSGLITGWTVVGTAGQFQPGPPATTAYFNSVPDGVTVAYDNNGSISQTVAPLVQLGVIYTLQVDVGVRKDVGNPGTEALVINGNTYFATGVPATPGGWSTFTATYTGTAADVGKAITIQLSSTGAQGDWDNVRLSDSTNVPEPASGLLMGLALLACAGIVRPKRRVT